GGAGAARCLGQARVGRPAAGGAGVAACRMVGALRALDLRGLGAVGAGAACPGRAGRWRRRRRAGRTRPLAAHQPRAGCPRTGWRSVIGTLRPESIAAAAKLLAGSMRDNPLHQRVFAGDEARLEPLLAAAFARLLRRQMRGGHVLGAWEDGVLVGVAAMVAPGHCRPGLAEKLAMLPLLARA